jgi:fumarylacetoacetate (FAA) hydrolase
MKLVTYLDDQNEERVGLLCDGQIVDFANGARELNEDVPGAMNLFLRRLPDTFTIALAVEKAFRKGMIQAVPDQQSAKILAPVPHPPSCRDAYAFRQHVEAARKNRGAPMIPEFDQFPVFYFTNHHGIIGPGDLIVEDDHLDKLDFELEVAAVIGKKGRNVEAKDADAYVFGFTIMNDFSARTLQMDEMQLSLGPAKGKDFATGIGPWLVTLDELEPRKIVTPYGTKYDLEMKAFHNGKLVSQGNLKDMNWTFAEIIERASYGVDLYPGDLIGSGTVGTGCYLELNGTGARLAKEKDAPFTPAWLKEGDTIELEVTGLGKLSHRVVKAKESRSILKKKKKT